MRKVLSIALIVVIATMASGAAASVSGKGVPPWKQALNIRSQTLNERYGLDVPRRTTAASPGWRHALAARSDVMNRLYRLGEYGGSLAIAVPAAQADDPSTFGTISSPTEPTAVERIVNQERARAGDPALFGPSSAPVQIVGPRDKFDLVDASIGGAAGLAVALLAAAGVALRSGSRRRTPEAASLKLG